MTSREFQVWILYLELYNGFGISIHFYTPIRGGIYEDDLDDGLEATAQISRTER